MVNVLKRRFGNTTVCILPYSKDLLSDEEFNLFGERVSKSDLLGMNAASTPPEFQGTELDGYIYWHTVELYGSSVKIGFNRNRAKRARKQQKIVAVVKVVRT